MKKFKFRLQRVLDFRRIVKDEKKRELLARNHELSQARDRLVHLTEAELANAIPDDTLLNVSEVLLTGNYGNRLKEEIVGQRLNVLQAEDKANQALSAYIEAASEEKALVTLKQKRLEEYMKYLEQEEGKALDEYVTSKGNTFFEEEQVR